MNRRFLLNTLCIFVFVICANAIVIAQGGDARLPGAKPAKPKPTPTPTATASRPPREEAPAPPAARPPASTPDIAFNQLVTSNLDPQKSGQIKVGIYYDEFMLNATDADMFTIFLQSPNPALQVQVYEKEGKGLPTLRDPRSGEFKLDTPGGTLPKEGEYRVRIVGALDPAVGPIGYTLKVNHTGLTEAGYQARLQSIIAAFNAPDAKNDPKNVDDTIAKLEKLANDDDTQPGAYELLDVMYLYHKEDIPKAAAAMDRAIALKGSAVFQVTYDPQTGRKPQKKPNGQYDWVESKTGWLRIQPDRIVLVDVTNEQLQHFNFTGAQLKEAIATKLNNSLNVVQLKSATAPNKPYQFVPRSKGQPEIDLILKLIKTHVPPRG